MENVKHWIPLESNPDVFTQLIHQVGISPDLAFHDVFSLDPEILSLVPRPVLALILVFPASSYEKAKTTRDLTVKEYEGKGEDEDVVWFKQTVHNACGFYGILHAVCNGGAREMIVHNSAMARFLSACIPLGPTDRAKALEASNEIESAYRTAALQGDSEVPASAEDEVDFHYVCFVKSTKNGHLYELDGDRKGPVDHGAIDLHHDDLLSGDGLRFIQNFISREKGANVNFSLLALASV